MKILIVEDNARVARFLLKGLHEAGHVVDHAANGRDGLFLAKGEHYDVIVMDRVLPDGVDGLAIVEALRRAGNKVPILILSALSDVDSRVLGLRAGGDDYLVKPFAFGELLARLDALARRARQTGSKETVLALGELTIDLLTHKVMRSQQVIALKPQEFKLLEYLMRHANQLVTRGMLLENVWHYDFDPQTNVIDVQISKLRQKIDTKERPMLKTIRYVGYMLTCSETD